MASAAIGVIVGSQTQKLNAVAPPQQQFGAGPRLYVASPDKWTKFGIISHDGIKSWMSTFQVVHVSGVEAIAL